MIKLLLYCTKNKKRVRVSKHLYTYADDLYKLPNGQIKFGNSIELATYESNEYNQDNFLNGKIVAECECEKVESFNCCCVPYRKENNLGYELFVDNGVYKVEWKENINLRDENKRYNNPEIYKDDGVVFERKDRYINTMLKNDDLGKAKITPQELLDYIGLGNEGYALHLSNVKVFDEPKELYDYDIKLTPQKLVNPISKDSIVISNINYCCTKAPQNMCNVYDRFGNRYILISIKPEWLCKILNGEKTIEVRKKILNSLKEVLENE